MNSPIGFGPNGISSPRKQGVEAEVMSSIPYRLSCIAYQLKLMGNSISRTSTGNTNKQVISPLIGHARNHHKLLGFDRFNNQIQNKHNILIGLSERDYL
jgi:hypothetical protein